jgi:hypothetical protein
MNELHSEYERWFEKALGHLKFSVDKLSGVVPVVADMDDEELESWEGLVSRFARASDIFFSKVLRSKIEMADPGFRGSFVDMLNLAEKLGFIEDVGHWRRIRELRNFSVHEYAGESIDRDLVEIRELSTLLLSVRRGAK